MFELKKLLFVFLIAILFIYIYDYLPVLQPIQRDLPPNSKGEELAGSDVHVDGESILRLIGQSEKEIVKTFGEPERIDKSAYDYDWWIYHQGAQLYLQVGMQNGKVVTVYGIGDNINSSPFQIGLERNEMAFIPMDMTVQLQFKGGTYKFEMSEEDLHVRPLVKYEDVFVQLYFDHFLNTLSSIRVMDKETLLKQKPYELSYRGKLPQTSPLTEQEWNQIEEGSEAQIFAISNIIRNRHQLKPVSWSTEVAQVAYLHSKDMSDNNYFSHVSPTRGDLADRLKAGNVFFLSAGENIASNYLDGPAAVEGWLNSEGHRKALLNEKFTYLGVGVYEKYYTQNFIYSLK